LYSLLENCRLYTRNVGKTSSNPNDEDPLPTNSFANVPTGVANILYHTLSALVQKEHQLDRLFSTLLSNLDLINNFLTFTQRKSFINTCLLGHLLDRSDRFKDQDLARFVAFEGSFGDLDLTYDPRVKNFQIKQHKNLRYKIENTEVTSEELKEYMRLSSVLRVDEEKIVETLEKGKKLIRAEIIENAVRYEISFSLESIRKIAKI